MKFDMKTWFPTSLEKYPFSFQVYTGKDDSANEPLEERVVKTLTALREDNSNHSIYFDNFFSSTSLCRDLADKNVEMHYKHSAEQNTKLPADSSINYEEK